MSTLSSNIFGIIIMASWKSDEDIARDMDILSGIQSPVGKVRSYTSWGRGKSSHFQTFDDTAEFQAVLEETPRETFEWFSEKTVEKFPDSISRGKKLQILQDNHYRDKELEVHQQLRAALGPGHSNAFIEESFKQRFNFTSNNDLQHVNSPREQFEDSVETPVRPPLTNSGIFHSDNSIGEFKTPIHQPSEFTLHPKEEVSKEEKPQRKRKRRQYRNAVLESLERMSNSGNFWSVENSNPVNGPIFGNKQSNIPPAGYFPGRHSETFGNETQVCEHPFEYKKSEFPALQ